ncbi:MAG: hypothetical protein ABSA33_07440 [Candidatus Micrarchaeaceae archaeon]
MAIAVQKQYDGNTCSLRTLQTWSESSKVLGNAPLNFKVSPDLIAQTFIPAGSSGSILTFLEPRS